MRVTEALRDRNTVRGFYTLLRSALTEAGYDDGAEPRKPLIVGDLFDRGKEAAELQSFLLDLSDRDEVILVRGNHEDLYEELVTADHGLPYNHHLSNRTYHTALQLTSFNKRHAKISPLASAHFSLRFPLAEQNPVETPIDILTQAIYNAVKGMKFSRGRGPEPLFS